MHAEQEGGGVQAAAAQLETAGEGGFGADGFGGGFEDGFDGGFDGGFVNASGFGLTLKGDSGFADAATFGDSGFGAGFDAGFGAGFGADDLPPPSDAPPSGAPPPAIPISSPPRLADHHPRERGGLSTVAFASPTLTPALALTPSPSLALTLTLALTR